MVIWFFILLFTNIHHSFWSLHLHVNIKMMQEFACWASIEPLKMMNYLVCSTNTFVTNSFIYSFIKGWFVKISSRCRHAPMVGNGAVSHKIKYIPIF